MFSLSATVSGLLRTRCSSCFRFRNYATRKRFFKGTGIVQNDSRWEVTLDHRRLKTPNGKPLLVDSEPLARAIAAEWDAQKDKIALATMHLTALCNTALDNPAKLTTHDIVSFILEFFPTDTLLFHNNDEEELRVLQQKKWMPIIEWFEKRFDVKQGISTGLEPPAIICENSLQSIPYISYPSSIIMVETDWREILRYLKTQERAGIVFGVEALKSPLLMIACIERCLDPKDAVLLARLEEEYQSERWGRVSWAHELSQAELTSRLAAALLVIQANSERHSQKKKASPQPQQI